MGYRGTIPWKSPLDLLAFRRITTACPFAVVRGNPDGGARHAVEFTSNAVIMGRVTWESLGESKPLRDRVNVVLSKDSTWRRQLVEQWASEANKRSAMVLAASSMQEAIGVLSIMHARGRVCETFVIGGQTLIAEALKLPQCDKVYWTIVRGKHGQGFVCDRNAPVEDLRNEYQWNVSSCSDPVADGNLDVSFAMLERARIDLSFDATFRDAVGGSFGRRNFEEEQYLSVVSRVLNHGTLRKQERTGVGTKSVFGEIMRFSLREGTLPLLTTKKVFWKGVKEETLWFLRGETNAKTLNSKGVKIWNKNGSRAFLDQKGLTGRKEGDLGPVYGFQWRHFGADYSTCDDTYEGKGVDQLRRAIDLILHRPQDRRIIVSAWNPIDLESMALPPCHLFYQFYVADGELSCQMYQRSCDLGLGVPFNIAGYALITHLVAHACGLQPGELIIVMGDAHVYTNHEKALREQLQRSPRNFPKLRIMCTRSSAEGAAAAKSDGGDTERAMRWLTDPELSSRIDVDGYDPHPPVGMDMAV
jgi:dihydrofolate reductase / thymidylate synthase